ncbi:hypothetical protein EV426DRAFT_198695 [Tirmania nivea]|nr:hypothetical protein EV426DRAFT_198695 [Tirmania nivea]
MNSLNNSNLPVHTYMNGSPMTAGGNPGIQSSTMGNGLMGGGLMVGQMPSNASQQQQQAAALYHYQQQMHAQQMTPYAKMPAQMMNTGNPMMAVGQDASQSHASPTAPTITSSNQPVANASPMLNPNTVAAQQQQLFMNRAMETQNHIANDKSRVTLLLEINSELLRETVQLQTNGKVDQEDKTSDKGFYGCMRRLQANLAYLAAVADGSRKPGTPIPQSPAILVPPPDMPSLTAPYKKLQELFPGAKATNPPVQSVAQSGQAQSHSRGSSQNASPRASNTPRPPSHATSQSPRNHASPTPPTQLPQQVQQQQPQQSIPQQVLHQQQAHPQQHQQQHQLQMQLQHQQQQHHSNTVMMAQSQQLQLQNQQNQIAMQQHNQQMQGQAQMHHPMQMTTQMSQPHMMAPHMPTAQLQQQQLAMFQQQRQVMAAAQAQAQAQFNQMNQVNPAHAQALAQRQAMQQPMGMNFNGMQMMMPHGMQHGVPIMQGQQQMYINPSQQNPGAMDMSAWGYQT